MSATSSALDTLANPSPADAAERFVQAIRAAVDAEEQLARDSLYHPTELDPVTKEVTQAGEDTGAWRVDGLMLRSADPIGLFSSITIYDEGGHSEEQLRHIAHHDPASVLTRRVPADRKILALHNLERTPLDQGFGCSTCNPCPEYGNLGYGPCATLLALAERYGVEGAPPYA